VGTALGSRRKRIGDVTTGDDDEWGGGPLGSGEKKVHTKG